MSSITISGDAIEKDAVSKWVGKPLESYPLERPDTRVLAFDLKRKGRNAEETLKQQCQVEASPLIVEFAWSAIRGVEFTSCSDLNRTTQYNISHPGQHVCVLPRDKGASEEQHHVHVQILCKDSGKSQTRGADHVRDTEVGSTATEQGP